MSKMNPVFWPLPSVRPTSPLAATEKCVEPLDAWQKASQYLAMYAERPLKKNKVLYSYLLSKIGRESDRLKALSDTELQKLALDVRRTRSTDLGEGSVKSLSCHALIPYIFALIKEASRRILGMPHFDSQLLGGLVMLHGNIAEMQTGEGKTLTATLPVAAAALLGVPVHVITVNDYLAKRDAEQMRPLYEFLGLSVGCIQSDDDLPLRREHYSKDICYCSNNELVFDYLKDQLNIGECGSAAQRYCQHLVEPDKNLPKQLMLRGLHFALIDEADSVLIDEARTPLIISGDTPDNAEQSKVFSEALAIAKDLPSSTYDIEAAHKKLLLNVSGENLLQNMIHGRGSFWRGWVRSVEVVTRALSALHLYKVNEDYIVRNGLVEIIDEHTGRVMEGRRWEQGLHQLIELKEGCELTSTRKTLKQITYQKFFRRYHHVAGMTGTGREVTNEFWQVYNLALVHVAPNKKNRRICIGRSLFASEEQKWAALVERLLILSKQGRSVLVGTASVSASEKLSKQLECAGVEHQLLNAKTDDAEAEIIAQAGQVAKITIATALAGRGTDIKLTKDSHELGGLHVIITQLSDAGRIDRQLVGRAGRQGEPGSYEWMASLDDGLVARAGKNARAESIKLVMKAWPLLGRLMGFYYLTSLQKRIEQHHKKIRQQVLDVDILEGDLLSFIRSNR